MTTPFTPNITLYVRASTSLANEYHVFDITPHINLSTPSNNNHHTITASVLDSASTLTKPLPNSDALYSIKRAHWYSTTTTVTHNQKDRNEPVAEISAPLWALGTRHFKFPANSPNSGHEIVMKPLGMGRRAEGFVEDSVQYTWETLQNDLGQKRLGLFKHVGGEKAKVAEYGARNAWDKGGLLVVDLRKDEGVDLLVAVMSCVALGMGTDSFTK